MSHSSPLTEAFDAPSCVKAVGFGEKAPPIYLPTVSQDWGAAGQSLLSRALRSGAGLRPGERSFGEDDGIPSAGKTRTRAFQVSQCRGRGWAWRGRGLYSKRPPGRGVAEVVAHGQTCRRSRGRVAGARHGGGEFEAGNSSIPFLHLGAHPGSLSFLFFCLFRDALSVFFSFFHFQIRGGRRMVP